MTDKAGQGKDRAAQVGADRAGARRRAESLGRGAETAAALWLRAKGYRLLARRLKTAAGEIDLVAQRGKTLVFVEVKARPTAAAGAESLRPRQRDRIARAAEAFVQTRPDLVGLDWRFDLIVVTSGWRPRHIKDAWRPGLA